jgi:alkanesulfonate monooxygenase SsuD/methylene tetrahydromethanopterin reductase-like flavin-dependent oxidoreductase (luciferase family)
MRTLWCDDVSQYDGEFYQLAPTRQFPKPVQQPHPPVHFGGEATPPCDASPTSGRGGTAST